ERKDGAMVLRRGFTVGEAKRSAVVEDVVTTGKSTREAAGVAEAAGAEVVAYGSILNRSGVENPLDRPYRALLTLSLETWQEPACVLCRDHVPVDTPGSRFSARS
ncbi:MAG: orotate phosphoribosyltransferase, partial [Acidobacteriota bacterium]